MKYTKVKEHIVSWLKDYVESSGQKGFVIGVSGGIDSAVSSTLCAMTGHPVLVIEMPIHQGKDEVTRSQKHIEWLKENFDNVRSSNVDLTDPYDNFLSILVPSSDYSDVDKDTQLLTLANTRSRLRMVTLYSYATLNSSLVCGTGNKVEDFGVGFFTKYGDGGVDISPIADLMKSEVYGLGCELGIIDEILTARPTDGLWDDGRTDEDQIGASYDELEWAMTYEGDEKELDFRQKEVLQLFRKRHNDNKHKMVEIPVCEIPEELKC